MDDPLVRVWNLSSISQNISTSGVRFKYLSANVEIIGLNFNLISTIRSKDEANDSERDRIKIIHTFL